MEKKFTLKQLRDIDTVAFNEWVKKLVEDCDDKFVLSEEGIKCARQTGEWLDTVTVHTWVAPKSSNNIDNGSTGWVCKEELRD